MNWSDERYVRVYTRDTVSWLMLSFEAKALWLMLLRKADRAGVIPLESHGRKAVGVIVGHPDRTASLVEALGELLEDGCIEIADDESALVIPNFIEAQEATKSPTERQREYRERAREEARAGLPSSAQRGCVIYFIQSEHGGQIKIGRADDLAKRLMGLQTGRPDKLIVLAAASGTRADERHLHNLLEKWRERGEWFAPSPAVLKTVEAVSRLGSGVWSQIDTVLGDVSSPETLHPSPETSPVASPVTPYLAVPDRAVPSQTPLSASADRGVEQPTLFPQEPTTDEASGDARAVFDHWCSVMQKGGKTAFDSKRRSKVQARLKDGYTVEQLCKAVDGCALTPHNMGQNDRGEKYNDLELICRDSSHVDRFIANAADPPKPTTKPMGFAHIDDKAREAFRTQVGIIHDF